MQTRMTTAQLREAYLDFFESKGCVRHPSAPLVNENDPTTLFTVAGMAQFKDSFLGRGDLPFSRATTCQKCMRTNDILEVGRTPRHHTFFEMLGNFSFDDYFKRETISWAWEFLTGTLGLDGERLWVTTHHIDDEAWDIWHDEVGVPTRRMERLGDADNFWPADAPLAGPLGPGGCCSEIFWDFEPERGDGSSPGTDEGDRFVEIWNLVFPQFNVVEPRQADGRYTLEELGRTNIDTGSGLERLACVVQGATNNFDIDLFQAIIAQVSEVTGVAYRRGEAGEANALLRRIADHVRAVTFAMADQARPDNKGAGYILRRLIRRATLDADKLGLRRPGLYRVVDAVVDSMGQAYPELSRVADAAAQALEREEEQFRRTLRRGWNLLERELAVHRQADKQVFDGETAFHLYETDGFPREITEELVADAGMRIDEAGWQRAEAAHQAVSRSKTAQVFEASELLDAKGRLGPTTFVGYDQLEADARLTMLEVDGRAAERVGTGQALRFTLDRTPFYAESGGQVGDRGRVDAADGSFSIAVDDVQKDGGLWIHSGRVVAGEATSAPVHAAVDTASRSATTQHHSATHLLHSALCRALGDHVEQQGSKVEPDCLRFDFNNDQAVDDEQLAQVEAWVDEQIAADHPVRIEECPIDEARQRGAKALFGEKYGDRVRVVEMGGPAVSIELCGGCHVPRTGRIGAFRILREEASSAGVRRITALAGERAAELAREEAALARACADELGLVEQPSPAELRRLARLLKATAEELPGRLATLTQELAELRQQLDAPAVAPTGGLVERTQALQNEAKELRKRAERVRGQAAGAQVQEMLAGAPEIDGIALVIGEVAADGKGLRQALDQLTGSGRDYAAVLASRQGGKAVVGVAASAAAQERGIHAGRLVGELAPIVGGRGGGKPNQAQGGGPGSDAVPELIEQADALLRQRLAAATGRGPDQR